MIEYDLETTDFALSNQGVHLLRSGYNYKTLPYQEIDTAILKKGVEISNPVITFICGVLFVYFAVLQCIWAWGLFENSDTRPIPIESIVVIVFPALLGIYCIIISLMKGPILQIERQNKKHRLSLKKLAKLNGMEGLKTYLTSKLQERFVIKNQL